MSDQTQLVDLYPQTEPISEHCRHGLIGEQEIILVELSADDRATIEAWIEFSEGIRQDWNSGKPLLILVDVSLNDFFISPYLLRRAEAMMQVNPDLMTYIAFVMRPSLGMRVLTVTTDIAMRTARTTRFKMMKSREEAYNWLCDVMPGGA